MLHRLWILLAFLAAPAVRAQTCGGALSLSFYDAEYEARGNRYVIPVQSLGVTAQYLHGAVAGFPTSAEARRDPALTLEGEDQIRRESRLYVPGTTLAVAPRCGLGLLHLVLEYKHETMTLDVYRVPSHVVLQPSGPIPFRPGRYVLDFETAPTVQSPDGPFTYDAAAVRPAPK